MDTDQLWNVVAAWMQETAELLADTRNQLETDPAVGRQLLRRCLPNPLVVTPDGDGWTFSGEGISAESDVKKVVPQLESRESGLKKRDVREHIGLPPNTDPP